MASSGTSECLLIFALPVQSASRKPMTHSTRNLGAPLDKKVVDIRLQSSAGLPLDAAPCTVELAMGANKSEVCSLLCSASWTATIPAIGTPPPTEGLGGQRIREDRPQAPGGGHRPVSRHITEQRRDEVAALEDLTTASISKLSLGNSLRMELNIAELTSLSAGCAAAGVAASFLRGDIDRSTIIFTSSQRLSSLDIFIFVISDFSSTTFGEAQLMGAAMCDATPASTPGAPACSAATFDLGAALTCDHFVAPWSRGHTAAMPSINLPVRAKKIPCERAHLIAPRLTFSPGTLRITLKTAR
eukprot:9496618-Pyramimonas_sp.AAC.2